MNKRTTPCECKHERQHHVPAIWQNDAGEPIGMMYKCLEPGCPCERFIPQEWLDAYAPRDEGKKTVAALHAQACLSGVRYVLIMHYGNVCTLHTNASNLDDVPEFVSAVLDGRDDEDRVEHVVHLDPVQSRTDPRRFMVVPPLLAQHSRCFIDADDPAPWAPFYDDEDDDEDDDVTGELCQACGHYDDCHKFTEEHDARACFVLGCSCECWTPPAQPESVS